MDTGSKGRERTHHVCTLARTARMRGKTRSNKFERATESAIYVQIAEKIRHRLSSGELKEGSKLSSIREISEAYDVNYLTARQALKFLESLRDWSRCRPGAAPTSPRRAPSRRGSAWWCRIWPTG